MIGVRFLLQNYESENSTANRELWRRTMRAPFQILAIPYRENTEFEFCVLHRSDIDQYQFVAGGGEDDEKPIDAALREIFEETAVKAEKIIPLTSLTYVPSKIISEKHRKFWSKGTYVIPEYAFAFKCDSEILLSDEHTGFEWLSYDEAVKRLTWDSNKTALYELYCRLHEQ